MTCAIGGVERDALAPDLAAEHGTLMDNSAKTRDRAEPPADQRIGGGRFEQPVEIGGNIARNPASLPDCKPGWRVDQVGIGRIGIGEMPEQSAVVTGYRGLAGAQWHDRAHHCRLGQAWASGRSGDQRHGNAADPPQGSQNGVVEAAHHGDGLWHARPAGGKDPAMLVNHVLFLDGEAMVIDKPAGLPVDPPRDGSLSLDNHLAGLTFGFKRWPQPVHRLDRDTSGCLLLSRNPKAHARLHQAFEAGQVIKHYLAVLDGVPDGVHGMIDLPLIKVSSAVQGWRMHGDPAGKPSRTAWRVLAIRDGRAFVAFAPETGRTHQIRVHAAEGLGIPVVGDPVYGRGGSGSAAAGGATLLHARSIELPRAGKPPITATAPLPDRFRQAGFDDVGG